MSRLKRGVQRLHDISSRCHPEQSERSMHSACGTSEGAHPPTILRCDPERSRHFAKRSACGVEGSLRGIPEVKPISPYTRTDTAGGGIRRRNSGTVLRFASEPSWLNGLLC
jgi:hypothetical protein